MPAELQDIVSFTGPDGENPEGSLITDSAGNIYGTTRQGSTNSSGTVFEITRDGASPTGYSSTPTTLVTFNGPNGSAPSGSLITDSAGNLYGTTESGGAHDDGTVFEITRDSASPTGYSTTPTTLISFQRSNGASPSGSLIADGAGNLYGTTFVGGAVNRGTVFEVVRDSTSPTGYSSTPTTRVSFDGSSGSFPAGSLIADSAGNFYGTASTGGTAGKGTVFKLTQSTGYSATTLFSFPFNDTAGSNPQGSLIADSAGNLYGTAENEGANVAGTVFEVVRNPATATGYDAHPVVLVSFNGANGKFPVGSLISDVVGDLFGTTEGGGANGEGTVFEIARDSASPTGYSSTPTTLVSFNGTNGSRPVGSLIADRAGNLYGTTGSGGPNGGGTVFEVTNTGFVTGFVTCFVTGTAIATARGAVAVEDLRLGDVAVTASGRLRPITWIGHRDLDGHGRSLPHDQQPIRIREGAFGQDAASRPMPARDLCLSPGHPVLVAADADHEGGELVPIMCLVNGTSIRREPRGSVTYWHVELDVHDILLADGLAAESYLDWGDRAFFSEGTDHALANPDFVVPGLAGRCRPVAVGGPVVEAERRRLDMVFAMRLAGACAWPDEAYAGDDICT